MDLDEQKELVQLIDHYNKLDSATIKKNITRCIDKSSYFRKSQALADALGLDLQTIYLWRQPQKKTTISFESLLKLASVLGIPVREIIESDVEQEVSEQ